MGCWERIFKKEDGCYLNVKRKICRMRKHQVKGGSLSTQYLDFGRRKFQDLATKGRREREQNEEELWQDKMVFKNRVKVGKKEESGKNTRPE